MFGIGFSEFVLIAVILIICVGPSKMPAFARTIGKMMRQFRNASEELKKTVGVDELMRDGELRQLTRDPLGMNTPKKPAAQERRSKLAAGKSGLTERDRVQEVPREGVDLAYAAYVGKHNLLEAKEREHRTGAPEESA